MWTMRAMVLSCARRVTRTSSEPLPLMLPAKTLSPATFSTGNDSPVTGAWFSADSPETTMASTGTFSPGRTSTMSPSTSCATGTVITVPSLRTKASLGAMVIRSRIARRARAMVRDSSHSETPNSQMTVAASSHSPRMSAPTTAMTISTWMSSTRRCTERQALRAGPGMVRTMARA